jgi:diadenosine tetraphosphate (Ap4A) HIT family hydrolase
MTAAFTLDETLARDTYTLGRFPLCRVLMLNDARYPWLVLAPERADISEIIDLAAPDRALLMTEIAAASEAVRAAFAPDKLNVGALGNMVRQLHVHVIGRFVSDIAWPGPVWGHSPAVPYPAHMAGMTMDRFVKALRPFGFEELPA